MHAYRIGFIIALIGLMLVGAAAQNSSVVPGGSPPGGSNTQVQYNNSGAFGGSSKFAFNAADGTVTIDTGAAGNNIGLIVQNSAKGGSPGITYTPIDGISYFKPNVGNSGGGVAFRDYNNQEILSLGASFASSGYYWEIPGAGATEVGDLLPRDLLSNIGIATKAVKAVYSRSYVSRGAVPTPSGACAIDTQVGGNTAGTFQSNGGCTTDTVILTFALTAPNGWACFTTNRTAVARAMPQTASSTTTATLTGTMTDNDVVQFACTAY